ncbi:putative CAMK CAMKL KIN4 protein kinase [Rosellinia necatrix]|uniref:non-specific serine/threonine protein kinase n=1 Tax=Rosellinia necatrix TaxID=77044 RepID=A0A1S7UME2_ROSNE|nr:putative CAMK CAMKL KIN4 protein kinase [Rosellinia necatrix]
MSSAALQPAPHQPTSLSVLNTHSPSASATNHQYTPAQSPNREGHYATRDHPSTSPGASSKRPSRRPSENSANAMNPTPYLEHQQPTIASRTTLGSPPPVVATSAEYEKPTSSRRHHEPPVAPPRTSSTQNSGSGASGSRRTTRAEDRAAGSPKRAAVENGKMNTNGYSDTGPSAYEESNSRAKRAASQYVPQGAPQAPDSSKDHRQTMSTAVPVRTRDQHAASTTSKHPSREASEVLNQVIVSQPEVDLERERERQGEAQPYSTSARGHGHDDDDAAPPPVVQMHEAQDESRRSGRSRHDHSKREKSTRFGDYFLGNTIGEGEFGKVKLGWKQDGGVQVAIKLIRRDSVGNNPSRLAKIYREVSILRGLSHPNIVRLHEMSETERHIGIVLEYASGGELFDYILNHRYLKDHAARKLFAQLISGVGYLHKKGIVHRDLKLENLLLDRNRNIIITDFGFANTFDAADELTEEEELNLPDRDYVKRTGLDKTKPNGMRRGDLMQTSCGSPCYAAPELVVSDSLYTGRKVDVWSCGVILYAMLAGYLPFDDDPDNPEGDNINLLYKYIVNTPLTFPEYVTPHARDLLRRILVPSPRKRADLFEVARHSWLSEYAHVVELITSTTTTSSEIQNTTVPSDEAEPEGLTRSASVREPAKTKTNAATAVGDLARKQGKVDTDETTQAKPQRDNKRRTVQVEYVAPTTQTQRGAEQPEDQESPHGKAKAKPSSQAPVDVRSPPHDKPLPKDPPVAKDPYTSGSSRDPRKPPSSHRRDVPPRVNQGRTSDHPYMTTAAGPPVSRPATGGSMHSSGSRGFVPSSRASIQQPKSSKYVISNPIPQESHDVGFGRPSISMPPKFAEVSGFNNQAQPPMSDAKGHRRSNTIGEIGGKLFGRSGSIFGARKKRADQGDKLSKKYPPVSMSNTMPGESRTSMDSRASRRSFSLGLGKKRSGSISGSQLPAERQPNPRRFSLMKAIGLSKDPSPPSEPSQSDLPIQDPPEMDTYGRYINQNQNPGDLRLSDGTYEQPLDSPLAAPQVRHDSNPTHRRYPSESQASAIPSYLQQGAVLNSESESSVDHPPRRPHNSAPYQSGYDSDQYDNRQTGNRQGSRVLQKNKRFVDAYDEEEYGRPRDHAGSSGAAKRVMDFFRRRGRARGGEV